MEVEGVVALGVRAEYGIHGLRSWTDQVESSAKLVVAELD